MCVMDQFSRHHMETGVGTVFPEVISVDFGSFRPYADSPVSEPLGPGYVSTERSER